jgi:branched-chain amino acid transport system ATP-binding protein
MSGAVLELAAVHKSFGGLKVIDDVGFAVAEGSRTALIGPNGAGKTTVFNLISGIYPVDAGRIVLAGKNLAGVPARARVRHGLARSFQNIRLMPHLSTVENVALGEYARRKLLGLALGRAARARAEAALAAAGLGTFAGQVVSNLPYGVQKRIEVVRALMAEPRLLLLDEPAAGLNTAETAELRALLEAVSARGITLLVIEHDMHFVRTLCGHVVVLNFGRKIYDGSFAGAQSDAAVREAYLGAAHAA